GRRELVLLRRLLEPAAEHRIREELRAAFAAEEWEVRLAEVAIPPAEGERVDGHHQRAVAGGLGPLDQADGHLAIVHPVELEPARRIDLRHLLDGVRRRARE